MPPMLQPVLVLVLVNLIGFTVDVNMCMRMEQPDVSMCMRMEQPDEHHAIEYQHGSETTLVRGGVGTRFNNLYTAVGTPAEAA